MQNFLDKLVHLPVEIVFVFIAIAGGTARYLTGFTHGVPFKLSIFLASASVAGFTGYIFAVFGATMALPENMLFVMAGTGGFFGEQTMKFVLEQVTKNKDLAKD